jgi:predicted ATPase
MIAAVHFRNFKALRSAAIRLEAFNLFIGPSGSGKTSLIQALLQLRALAGLPVVHGRNLPDQRPAGPQIEFHFQPPFQNTRVTLGCNSDELVCDLLVVDHTPARAESSPVDLAGEAEWAALRTRLLSIRAYLFDHCAMAPPHPRTEDMELTSNASNLAAVLAAWRDRQSATFRLVEAEFCRLSPEFKGLEFRDAGVGLVELAARPAEAGGALVPAESLAQGTLHLLAILTLAFTPQPPDVVCLEEADRGIHPRLLREVRDALYRLSYPKDFALERAPVQVITTTHSPYLLDLFKDHPEEVVLAHKRGRAATFERLSERADLKELLNEAHLGDLWFSGVLGGVPGEV